jgi:hypothetical protein
MNLEFSPQEQVAIEQLAFRDGTSSEQVVRQAIRLYQLYRLGHINIKWPKPIIDVKWDVITDDQYELEF